VLLRPRLDLVQVGDQVDDRDRPLVQVLLESLPEVRAVSVAREPLAAEELAHPVEAQREQEREQRLLLVGQRHRDRRHRNSGRQLPHKVLLRRAQRSRVLDAGGPPHPPALERAAELAMLERLVVALDDADHVGDRRPRSARRPLRIRPRRAGAALRGLRRRSRVRQAPAPAPNRRDARTRSVPRNSATASSAVAQM
jgi:hypothetical protein